MQETILPVGIQSDIDEAFCFREDSSYQERAHDYLERYEVSRGYRDTAVQAVVTDLARRAFQAGAEGRTETEAVDDLGEIQAELLETAAKCTRAAMAIGGGSSMNSLYIIGPVAGKPNDNKEAFVSARRALKADGFACAIPHDYIDGGTDWNTAMHCSTDGRRARAPRSRSSWPKPSASPAARGATTSAPRRARRRSQRKAPCSRSSHQLAR